MDKQTWHCGFCGHEGPFGDGHCESCKNDLVMHGYPVNNGSTPTPAPTPIPTPTPAPHPKRTAVIITVAVVIAVAVAIAAAVLTTALLLSSGSGKDPTPVAPAVTTAPDDIATDAPDVSTPAAEPPVTTPKVTEPTETDPPATEAPSDNFKVTGVSIKIPDALYYYSESSGAWYADIFVGQSIECDIEYTYTGDKKDPTWTLSSSNTGAISVDGLNITANKPTPDGYVTLTATVEDVTTTLRVYVNSNSAAEAIAIEPEAVELDQNGVTTVNISIFSTVLDDSDYDWNYKVEYAKGTFISTEFGESVLLSHQNGYSIYSCILTLTVDASQLNPYNDVLATIFIYRDIDGNGSCDLYSEIASYTYLRYTT